MILDECGLPFSLTFARRASQIHKLKVVGSPLLLEKKYFFRSGIYDAIPETKTTHTQYMYLFGGFKHLFSPLLGNMIQFD